MSAPLIPVNLVIGDRTYRIKTSPKDEESIRATVKIINEKILEFKTQFAGKDMQDYIAMVMVWYATQAAPDTSPALDTTLLALVEKMNRQVEEAVNREW